MAAVVNHNHDANDCEKFVSIDMDFYSFFFNGMLLK